MEEGKKEEKKVKKKDRNQISFLEDFRRERTVPVLRSKSVVLKV